MYKLIKCSDKGYKYSTTYIDRVYYQLLGDVCDGCVNDVADSLPKASAHDLYNHTERHIEELEDAIDALLGTSCGCEYILEVEDA